MSVPEGSVADWTTGDAGTALGRLLDATLDRERAIAERDSEVAAIERQYAGRIAATAEEILALEQQLEGWYRLQNKRIIHLPYGEIGVRTVGSPALELLEGFTWKKVEAKLKRAFQAKFFHKPKPPAIDKNKIKKLMTEEQLARFGMQLASAESFYIDLARLDEAA